MSVEAENTVVHLKHHVSLGLQQELRLEYKPLFLKDPFEVILSNIYDTNEREQDAKVEIKGVEVVKFKYLGLPIQNNEQYTREGFCADIRT